MAKDNCDHILRDAASIKLIDGAIKDSWQYPERDEEGELLRKVMAEGVVNMARY